MFVSVSHEHRVLSRIHRFGMPSATFYTWKLHLRNFQVTNTALPWTRNLAATMIPTKHCSALPADNLASTHGSGSRQHSHARGGYYANAHGRHPPLAVQHPKGAVDHIAKIPPGQMSPAGGRSLMSLALANCQSCVTLPRGEMPLGVATASILPESFAWPSRTCHRLEIPLRETPRHWDTPPASSCR